MDLKEIREKKSEDLQLRLRELSEEIFRARCVSEKVTPQKGAEINKLRKEYARLKTTLRQRELDVGAKQERETMDALLKESAEDSVTPQNQRAHRERKLRARKTKLNRIMREIEIVKGK